MVDRKFCNTCPKSCPNSCPKSKHGMVPKLCDSCLRAKLSLTGSELK